MWFPDASAGADDTDCIKRQLTFMAKGGMGGVEIGFLTDGCGIQNRETFGWGTPNWQRTLKKIMRAAHDIPSGFKVDFTINPHWPPNVFTIDPNDAAASSDLHYAYRKITAADIQSGRMDLPMPEIKLYDQKTNPFIFRIPSLGLPLPKCLTGPGPKCVASKHPRRWPKTTAIQCLAHSRRASHRFPKPR